MILQYYYSKEYNFYFISNSIKKFSIPNRICRKGLRNFFDVPKTKKLWITISLKYKKGYTKVLYKKGKGASYGTGYGVINKIGEINTRQYFRSNYIPDGDSHFYIKVEYLHESK